MTCDFLCHDSPLDSTCMMFKSGETKEAPGKRSPQEVERSWQTTPIISQCPMQTMQDGVRKLGSEPSGVRTISWSRSHPGCRKKHGLAHAFAYLFIEYCVCISYLSRGDWCVYTVDTFTLNNRCLTFVAAEAKTPSHRGLFQASLVASRLSTRPSLGGQIQPNPKERHGDHRPSETHAQATNIVPHAVAVL